MDRNSWRRARGGIGFGTILLIATGLLMVVPSVGGTPIHPPSSGRTASVPSPSVSHDTSCAVGSGPHFDAYDPVNHYVYVPNSGSSNLSILGALCHVVATVAFPSGAAPYTAAFNPTNDLVYVTDNALDQVYVISGTKLLQTLTSAKFLGPNGIAFDPGDALMAVANRASDTVTFISGTTVEGTRTVGVAPTQFAYDPVFDRFLVTNYDSDNVTSMNALDPLISADNVNIPVGTEPFGIAFDPANNFDFVANYGSNNVSAIEDNLVDFSLPVGSGPKEAVFDLATESVYVTNFGSDNISKIPSDHLVVNGFTTPAGSDPLGIAYDGATDQVFVTGYGTGTVYVYESSAFSAGPVSSGTTCAVGSNPVFDAYDPVTHDLYVPNRGSANLSILNGACKVVATVTFAGVAEPYAAAFDTFNNWVYVTDQNLNRVYVLSGTKLIHTITSKMFHGPSGTAFDPAADYIAVANGASDTVSFIFDYAVFSAVTVGSEPSSFAYDPYFDRLLVTNWASNNVTSMNASDPGVGNINIAVGTQPFGIAFDYATSNEYVANFGSHNVTVIDGLGYHHGSVSIGAGPEGVVWDQANLTLDVVSNGAETVSVIQGHTVLQTISGPSGVQLSGISYDEATDQVFVTGYASDEVYVYS
jgi:DNA-binding beta-propeller fold protein YncE